MLDEKDLLDGIMVMTFPCLPIALDIRNRINIQINFRNKSNPGKVHIRKVSETKKKELK